MELINIVEAQLFSYQEPLSVEHICKAVRETAKDILDHGSEIEAEGVRRAEAWGREADFRIWLVDGYGDPHPTMPDAIRIGDLILLTKRDLGEGHPGLPGSPFTAKSPNDVAWVKGLLFTPATRRRWAT